MKNWIIIALFFLSIVSQTVSADTGEKLSMKMTVIEEVVVNTKIGIDRYNELMPELVKLISIGGTSKESAFKPREIQVSIVECEFEKPVSLSEIQLLLAKANYFPASFEHAASLNFVTKENASGRPVIPIATRILGSDRSSTFFTFKYEQDKNAKEPYIDVEVKDKDVWQGKYAFMVVKAP